MTLDHIEPFGDRRLDHAVNVLVKAIIAKKFDGTEFDFWKESQGQSPEQMREIWRSR